MTTQEVKNIVEQELKAYEPVYSTLEDVPDWGKSTVQKLMNKGFLQGDGDGINIPESMLRVIVINDRAGVYGE